MPIIDIELVCEAEFGEISAAALADALGQVLGGPPGSTWVRLRFLAHGAYAENGCTLSRAELPAFVTVLHAHPPVGDALGGEAMAIALAVAGCVARERERVHVQYAPPGVGRQAFGGEFVQ